MSISHPFKKGEVYFIKTIMFYYIATYKCSNGKFLKFDNVQCILSIADWEDFWKSRPALPPAMKPLILPETHINREMIVEAMQWK